MVQGEVSCHHAHLPRPSSRLGRGIRGAFLHPSRSMSCVAQTSNVSFPATVEQSPADLMLTGQRFDCLDSTLHVFEWGHFSRIAPSPAVTTVRTCAQQRTAAHETEIEKGSPSTPYPAVNPIKHKKSAIKKFLLAAVIDDSAPTRGHRCIDFSVSTSLR